MLRNKLKKVIQNIVPKRTLIVAKDYISKIFDVYSIKSYSQEGEDLILRRIFEYKEQGFYIDIGANHPKRFSNTYLFYQKGWSGINIDATPGSMKRFNQIRPRDINLEVAIANEEKEMTFYMFDDPALNTFNKELAETRINKTVYQLIEQKYIKTNKLGQLLDTYLPENQNIDFMSIDVEGLDMETLKSNNWDKYIPKVILLEQSNFDFESKQDNLILNYLSQKGYKFIAKTFNTLFFSHYSFTRLAR
jgi:FkbM family methyltransferase